MDWVNDSKEWLDAGFLNPTVKGQWNDDWNKAMGSQSKVFAFLFPAWGIDFTLSPNWDGDARLMGSYKSSAGIQLGRFLHSCSNRY